MARDKNFKARSKAGKTAWADVPKEERSRRMSKLGKLRWKTTTTKK